jgi:DNA topoisomerase-2
MSNVAAYKKHTHREHILELPDTYIGSIDTHAEERWVWNEGTKRMEWISTEFCPGFYKLFDEVLVNALDHRVRLHSSTASDVQPVKNIWVNIDKNRITVRNDGDGIPVGTHPEYGMHVPEMIFGHLLTSSNYDKNEAKIVGGKNGYGAKLANIFSKEFVVETMDHRAGKKYKQVWKDNMTNCDKPLIGKATGKPFTEISYIPDLARFHWSNGIPTEIPADMCRVMSSRVMDAAACAGKECKVHLNGELLTVNTFQKYVSLYLNDDGGSSVDSDGDKKKLIAYEKSGDRWEVAAILTKSLHGDSVPDERHISFVNGIYTRRGGKHVEYIVKTVLADFCELAKKKAKLDVTSGMLKDSVVFFINSTITNPSFDTQTKETLTTPLSKWGSKPEISSKFCDQLIKIGLLDEAQAALDAKNARDTKKTDGKKRSTVRGIPKLEDATWAGTAKSDECTLILTEGDSAATTAISGLKVVGREKYGVFPLRGKLLNVKDASAAKKTANQELTYIKQILGLVTGKNYTDIKQLRYGRIMIMTDQDVDGSHIKGLIINLFHTDWPSLLKLDFICCMMTPLLKAIRGSVTHCFYSQPEFETWRANQPNVGAGWKIKYYKGLGTSTATEAREYFAQMNTLDFQWDNTSDDSINLAFNKKQADDRKLWLSSYDRNRQLTVKAGGVKAPYSRFVHDELIHFSSADNIRSLPSVMDGLKPSQRKILWACLKRNLTTEIKVAQLAGYVSETAAYHHGEMSLTSTIVGMAQDFVGANNINLLAPVGQFGSRLSGGDDAASARYIHTHLETITRSIFNKQDDGILNYLDDDGQIVEPETYFPVIPMLLVNGCVGIGTGFSTDIPSYNPLDLISILKQKLNGDIHTLTNVNLTPWWDGFRGSVVGTNDDKSWIIKGKYTFADDDAAHVNISELPVGTWTQKYKQFLEELVSDDCVKDKKPLRDIENNNNDLDVNFTLKMDHDAYHEARAYPAEFEKRFQINTTIRTTNMVAFDSKGKIRRYASIGEILQDFYDTRLDAYARRKISELKRMNADILELKARLKFIESILNGSLIVANQNDDKILEGIKALALPPLSSPDTANELKAYEYLLRIRIDRIKASAVEELRKQVADANTEHDDLVSKSSEILWLADLEKFEEAYSVFLTKKKEIVDEAQRVQTGVVKPVPKKRTYLKKVTKTK